MHARVQSSSHSNEGFFPICLYASRDLYPLHGTVFCTERFLCTNRQALRDVGDLLTMSLYKSRWVNKFRGGTLINFVQIKGGVCWDNNGED